MQLHSTGVSRDGPAAQLSLDRSPTHRPTLNGIPSRGRYAQLHSCPQGQRQRRTCAAFTGSSSFQSPASRTETASTGAVQTPDLPLRLKRCRLICVSAKNKLKASSRRYCLLAYANVLTDSFHLNLQPSAFGCHFVCFHCRCRI